MTTKIIAIDGGGGAGKSTLAHRLAAALGSATIVQADDFMDGPYPDIDWWRRLGEQVYEPLSKNLPGRYQRYDWQVHRLAEWHDVPVGGFVIVEGVTALRKEFRPYVTYGIWVETPKETRFQRGVERDEGVFGPEIWREWQSWDQMYFERDRPDLAADIIVDGTKNL